MQSLYATLIDHFGLTPWDIAKLTDRQIMELYFHPRDEYGGIKQPKDDDKPKAGGTLQSELFHVDLLRMNGWISAENAEECRQKLYEKYRGE